MLKPRTDTSSSSDERVTNPASSGIFFAVSKGNIVTGHMSRATTKNPSHLTDIRSTRFILTVGESDSKWTAIFVASGRSEIETIEMDLPINNMATTIKNTRLKTPAGQIQFRIVHIVGFDVYYQGQSVHVTCDLATPAPWH